MLSRRFLSTRLCKSYPQLSSQRLPLFSRGYCSSSADQSASYEIPRRNKHVARWLFTSSAFVCGVICVGGWTRLTESGLSIVDWKPLSGVVPPLNDAAWDEEFTRYKQFPEFKQNPDMTLDDFKRIFFWEWFHRVLARSIGVVYGLPLLYFAGRGYFKGQPRLAAQAAGFLFLGGCQGALGWYMVKSGLQEELLKTKSKATVSAYRLAAHLSLAFLIYAGMMRAGFGLLRRPMSAAQSAATRQLSFLARWTFSWTFVTVISGAFVAGLDAGLLYCDTFPWMAGGVFPPLADITALDPIYRNLFENGVAAQLWHRLMAGFTTLNVIALLLKAKSVGKSQLPRNVRFGLLAVKGALTVQVLLGFLTLMTYVHAHTAVTHQANSIVLLTTLIYLCAAVSPSPAVRLLPLK